MLDTDVEHMEDALDAINKQQIYLQMENRGNTVEALELEMIRIQMELFIKKYK